MIFSMSSSPTVSPLARSNSVLMMISLLMYASRRMCSLSLAGTSGINQAIRPVITTITFCQQQKSALLSNIYHKLLKQFIMVQLLWYDWNIIVNKALHHFEEIKFRKYRMVTKCNFLKEKNLQMPICTVWQD